MNNIDDLVTEYLNNKSGKKELEYTVTKSKLLELLDKAYNLGISNCSDIDPGYVWVLYKFSEDDPNLTYYLDTWAGPKKDYKQVNLKFESRALARKYKEDNHCDSWELVQVPK
jgi:hypothetical protein